MVKPVLQQAELLAVLAMMVEEKLPAAMMLAEGNLEQRLANLAVPAEEKMAAMKEQLGKTC